MIWWVTLRNTGSDRLDEKHYARVEADDQATAEAGALDRVSSIGFTEVVSSEHE